MEQRIVKAVGLAVALVILVGTVAMHPSIIRPPESAGGTGPNWVFIGIIGLLAARLLWTIVGGMMSREGAGTAMLGLLSPKAREPRDVTAGPSSAELAMEAAIKARHAPVATAAPDVSADRSARSASGAGQTAARGLGRPKRSGGFGRR